MAWCWTLVIVWILIALIIAWPSDWNQALKNLDATYFVLLGGPYAAWFLARTAVSTKVSNKTLQKPAGDGNARLSDLVSNDDGNPDLFDVQYVMFNLSAMAFVIVAFIHATPGEGFVKIPWGLLFLTGGPAGVFVANKALSGNGPAIFSITPTSAMSGDILTIYGQNFLAGITPTATPPASPAATPGAAPGAAPAPASGSAVATAPSLQVLIDGIKCGDVDPTDTVVRATVPPVPYTDLAPVDVQVVTITGVCAPLNGALVVRNKPTLVGLDTSTAEQGTGTITATGQWYDPSNSPLILAIDNTVAVTPKPGTVPTNQSATFTIPNLGAAPGLPKTVTVTLMQNGRVSAPKQLVVTASADPIL